MLKSPGLAPDFVTAMPVMSAMPPLRTVKVRVSPPPMTTEPKFCALVLSEIGTELLYTSISGLPPPPRCAAWPGVSTSL